MAEASCDQPVPTASRAIYSNRTKAITPKIQVQAQLLLSQAISCDRVKKHRSSLSLPNKGSRSTDSSLFPST